MLKNLPDSLKLITQVFLTSLLLPILLACTTQQAYEGLKAGRRAQCLEYPESEFEDCVDETKHSYDEYISKREEVIRN